jgi:uncharacterized repeat protein (TIGR03847 family)
MAEHFSSHSARDHAQRLKVEAIGEPGQRRFRLLAALAGETYVVWMEKQQLQALGLALEQMLEQTTDRGPEIDTSDPPLDFDTDSEHQFRVGRIELGYDIDADTFIVAAHDLLSEEQDDESVLRFRMSRGQARSLSRDAAQVVAAGRPICPMCGQPMSGDHHVCPEQNGHLPLQLDSEPGDDS